MNFRESVVEAVGRGLCVVTSTAQQTAAIGANFYDNVGLRGAGQTSDQASQLWGNLAGVFCNRQPQDIPGEQQRQFDGGQCDSVLYDLTYDIDLLNPNTGQTSPLSVVSGWFGPLGSVRVTEGGNGTELTARTGPGQPVQVVQDQTYGAGFVVSNIRNVSVSRRDGQPDNCGNQPGTSPPFNPSNFNYPTNLDFNDENNNPVSLPVSVDYSPVVVRPDASLVVPFVVNNVAGNNLIGELDITTGDINLRIGNGSGSGSPESPVELPPEEEPDGEVVVCGVRLSSTIVNPGQAGLTQVGYQSTESTRYFPRLGTVMFIYETESGETIGNPVDYTLLEQCVLSPRPAKSVEVFARNGVVTTWNLLVGPKPETSCCG